MKRLRLSGSVPLMRFRRDLARTLKPIMILGFVFSTVASYAQPTEKKITLDMKNVSMTELFAEIKKQTGNIFFFNTDDIPSSRSVTALFSERSVGNVLDAILPTYNLGYKVVEDYIVIFKTEAPVQQSQQTASRRTVTGRVLDENGEPIGGASVWIKETAIGTATNSEGEYTLRYEGTNLVIMASFPGHSSIEEPINNRDAINFKLTTDAEQVDEVVIVGYGIQKKESVIGAISSVKSDALKIPTSKLSTALAGQLAGIVSVQRSGEPGSGSEFWIRGISTFGAGTRPLVLVDGIERSLDYVEAEDIESFSILKDATATAVYGVRGANGVILITTRRGEEGRPRITVKAEAGLTGPTQMPETVNAVQFTELYNEAFMHERGSVFYTPDVIEKYRNGSDPDMYPDVDWFKTLYKNFSSNQRVNANVSGGGNIARYFISGSFYNEGSIFKEDDMRSYDSSINYKKFSFRSNVDINISPSTILNVNLANIYEKKNSPGASMGDIWGYTFSTSPVAFPVKYSNGSLSGPQDTGANPYNLLTQSGYRENYWNTAQALIGVTQDFARLVTPGLTANIKFSWDSHNANQKLWSGDPQTFFMTEDSNGVRTLAANNTGRTDLSYSRSNSGDRVFYLEGSITYNRIFNNAHQVGALLLYNQKDRSDVGAGSSEAALAYRNQGLAARMTYSFRNRYFVELNCGYNGSENFASGHRFGFFPAGAVGWLISEESFFQPIKRTLSTLKLKASYGLVGNDEIGGGRRFIYRPTINTGASGYQMGKSHTGYSGIAMGNFANANVSWEEAYKLNTGIELVFWNVLTLQADYFREQRRGIFMQRNSIPGFVGISTMPYVNIGKVDNQGFDSSLEYLQQLGSDWQVSLRANFTYNRNKIINDDQPNWKYDYQSKIGKPISQQFGLIAEGLYSSQEEIDNGPQPTFGTVRVGDIKYRDINSDGVIDSYDEVAIGRSTTPEIVYGFGFSVRWKRLDVSAFFQGVANTTFFLNGSAVRPFTSDNLYRSNMYEDIYFNRWTLDNPDPNATYPRLSLGNNTNNYRNSTYWQRNGAFMRLKTAEIGYTLPAKASSKIGMEHLRIYASGLNLLTFSKFKLWDPEMGGGHGQGYPPNRVFNFGMTINF